MRVLVLMLLLSGCIAMDEVDPGAVSFDGTGAGISTSFIECPEAATLDMRVSVEVGNVVVIAADGNGTVHHRKTVEGPGNLQSRLPMHGAAGEWRLDVMRQADDFDRFKGSYQVRIDCAPQD